MTNHIFTVFDTAAGMFLEPFVAPSIEFAIRGFRQAVNTPEHQFNVFPEDYTLYHIGEFDPTSGRVLPSDPKSLGIAITFINKIQPEEL